MPKFDDAYEAMRERDRAAWIADREPTQARVAAVHDAARAAVASARRELLGSFGVCDALSLQQLNKREAAKSLPTVEQQKAANAVATAAQQVAEKTDALMQLLEMYSTELLRIEAAQADLETAQQALKAAEVRRASAQTDVAALRIKHVETDYERGLRAGREYIAGYRAGGRTLG